MMKKRFEIPTIERVSFKVSDKQMCAINVTSGVTTDFGVIGKKTGKATESMTGKN